MDSRRVLLAMLLSVGALIFLFHLGGRDLWDPDETRYAVIAREMRENGNWILLHLNGEVYAEKPPLFFWLVNLSTSLFGSTEFANRLPSALAGWVTILVTFILGERLFNVKAGFLSGLVLATSFFFPQISRWMMLDSLLSLFFLLTLFFFYLGYDEERKRRRYYLLAGLSMGLGVLTKGPVAYLPVLIFFIFACLDSNLGRFWTKDLLQGCLLSLFIVLIWWIPACLVGGKSYVHWILYKQAAGTYFEGGKHFHPKPLYFYFIRFPVEFLPWAAFLPAAFVFGLGGPGEKKKGFLFLCIWFILTFLFFTFSRGKKDNYLLPLYPASAMLVGSSWDGDKKGFLFGHILLASLFLVSLVFCLSGLPKKFYPLLLRYHSLGVFILCYLSAGSLISLYFVLKSKKWPAFAALVAAFAFFHLHAAHILHAKFNEERSMRSFSERIVKGMIAGDDLKTYSFKSNGLIYYTGKLYIEEIVSKERLLEVLHSLPRVFIVFQKEVFDRIGKETGMEIQPLAQARVSHWNYVLISNR